MFDEPDDDTPAYCDFCKEAGHDIVDCEARREWHRERRDPDAALRLDPVCRDPD